MVYQHYIKFYLSTISCLLRELQHS